MYVSKLGPTSSTPVHNAASTNEAQTCWGRAESYEMGDGTASRAAEVRLKSAWFAASLCHEPDGRTDGRTDTILFLTRWSLREPRVLLEELQLRTGIGEMARIGELASGVR